MIIVLDGRLFVLGHRGEHVDRIATREQAVMKRTAAQERWADYLLVVQLVGDIELEDVAVYGYDVSCGREEEGVDKRYLIAAPGLTQPQL